MNKRELMHMIRDGRIITDDRLVTAVSLAGKLDSYRILDKPLSRLIIDALKKQPLSARELAGIIRVHPDDIKHTLLWIMNEPSLIEEGFIFRRAGRAGPEMSSNEYRYTIITIPIEARVIDPLFGFSILQWSDLLQFYVTRINWIPKEIYLENYCQNISNFWEIPVNKVKEQLNFLDFKFINSTIGPLPILSTDSIYKQLNNKLIENHNVINPFRFNVKHIEKEIIIIGDYLKDDGFANEDQINIGELQYYSIKLADVMNFCKFYKREQYISELNRLNKLYFSKIFINVP